MSKDKCHFPRARDKRCIEVNLMIIFLISQQNVCCNPSLEPSR